MEAINTNKENFKNVKYISIAVRVLIFLVMYVACLSSAALADEHFIRVGALGSNNGNDWTNAWTSLAYVKWIRGDTYYIAGGFYNEDVLINTALDDTKWIVLKKANAADNSNISGWNASFEETQAVISGTLYIGAGYLQIDGNTGSKNTGHGIKIDKQEYCSAFHTGDCVEYGDPVACCTAPGRGVAPDCAAGSYAVEFYPGVSNTVLKHLEITNCSSRASRVTRGLAINNYSGISKMIHIASCYIHGVSENANMFLGQQGTSYDDYGILYEGNWVEDTGLGGGSAHGQGFQFGPGSTQQYIIIRNNFFKDLSGSGFVSFLGGSKSYHVRFYNNIVTTSDKNTYTSSPGFIWSHPNAGTELADMDIYNNTIFNVSLAQITFLSPSLARIYAKNNLWVNSHFTGPHNGVAASNNGFYANTGAGIPANELGQINEVADPFTNSSNYVFQLKSTAMVIDRGVDLGAYFARDILNNIRPVGTSWDIGAYEFLHIQPSAPTNIRILQ